MFSNGYALLIGVGGDLKVTAQDAKSLQQVLSDPTKAAYPAGQVQLLTDELATRTGILDAFDVLIERVNRSPGTATVLVYYSGHGGRIEYQTKSPEYYLVPHGYDPARRADTAISGEDFTKKIAAIRARKLVVLLDCCVSGGIPQAKAPGETSKPSPLPPELESLLDQGGGQVIFTSSLENESSYISSGDNSIFTACLLEAFQGKAGVPRDKLIRVLSVLNYVATEVPGRAPGPQHPLLRKADNLENFPLCYYGGALTRLSARCQRLQRDYSSQDALYEQVSKQIEELRADYQNQAPGALKIQLRADIERQEAERKRLEDSLAGLEREIAENCPEITGAHYSGPSTESDG